jgi:hypothetical protein
MKLSRVRLVSIEATRQDDQFGTTTTRDHARHGAAHAVPTSLVARARDDAASAATTDSDRFPAQRRIVQDLDRREKGVEVDVQDRRVVDRGALRR